MYIKPHLTFDERSILSLSKETPKKPMSSHYLIQVGHHTIFLDRIDGYGSITVRLATDTKSHQFSVYLNNGMILPVSGTEAQCVEEQAMLMAHLDSISDDDPGVTEDHPQGMSG